MACRVGPFGVYLPLLWLLIPLAPAVAWLAMAGAPQALAAVDRIGAEARREADLASIEPGRFTVFGPDQAVVYGESVTPEGDMEKVFMQRKADNGQVEVVIASRGEQIDSDDHESRLLVLHDGRRYEGVPGTSRFRVVEFAEHGIPYRLPSLAATDPKPRAMSFSSLLKSRDLEHIAETQWRISVPLSMIFLALLAVPLSKSRPRAGRYGRLAVALLVFIIYFNMLNAAKAWIEQASISPALGLWWVHACVVLLTLMLLAYQNNWHKRILR